MFKATGGKGFKMFFSNGWGISIQIGAGNYCANRERPIVSLLAPASVSVSCDDAEIAIINPMGDLADVFDNDRVKGYVSPDEVAKIIGQISNPNFDGKLEEK
jgi:hypothetical protein